MNRGGFGSAGYYVVHPFIQRVQPTTGNEHTKSKVQKSASNAYENRINDMNRRIEK
jgi:DNA-directed RNA polymerase subunit L